MIRSMRKYKDSRLPQPPASKLLHCPDCLYLSEVCQCELEPKTCPTFLFTFPDLSDSNKVIRDLERALTAELGGGFTEWKARGAWNGPEGFVFESVRTYLVSTEYENILKQIVKRYLDIIGEKEGYFVRVGEHTIL